MEPRIRPPAVAGAFYPADPGVLRGTVQACLAEGRARLDPAASAPKALIAPHAGYVYSGSVAGSAYARVESLRGTIERVLLIGPSHRVPLRGLALSSATTWRTPLGDVALDREGAARLAALPQIGYLDAAHAQEHSLEVQLPFLQEALGDVLLLPIVAGSASAADVARALEAEWGGPETLVVVSSDLSHYHDYETARSLDRATTGAIESLRPDGLGEESACGRVPVRGLLVAAQHLGLAATTLDVRNSGDTAGPRDRVVGYGAWAFTETERRKKSPRDTLVALARESIVHGLRTGSPLGVDPIYFPPELRPWAASFVTLRRSGALRGCVGELEARRPLVASVAHNAFLAAFRDQRFRPLDAGELGDLEIHVSVLTAPTPIEVQSRAELLAALRPGIDGLVIQDGGRRATFLPAVWESLADAGEFLAQLERKAGLPPQHWSPTMRAWRYEVREPD